jgi:twitching motility protein PilT
LVFGTLHTNSASKTVDRIIDVFPDSQQAQIRTMLSESLRGVIAQTLFTRADKPGRVAALEVLVNTHAVANLIREGKTFQIPSAMQTGGEHGMITFESHLTKLVKEGKVSKEDADTFLGKRKPVESKPEAAAFPRPVNSGGSPSGGQQRPGPTSGTPARTPPAKAPSPSPQQPGNDNGIKILSEEPQKSGFFGFGKKTG